MDYLEHFGLEEEPFANSYLDRFFYDSKQHGQALIRLNHALNRRQGLSVVLGEIGTGKTTLSRRLLSGLDPLKFEANLLVIVHREVTPEWLLERIARQLGVRTTTTDRLSLLARVHEKLLEIHQEGRHAVVLIDEAQMLDSRAVMEEFRGLLNLETSSQKLISFVFFGLPDLEGNLMLDEPLAQRVGQRVRLASLDRDSTDSYIRHRLRVAGAEEAIFLNRASHLVHIATGGVPRLINTVCENALFEAWMTGEKTVTANGVREVARNLALPTNEAVSGDASDASVRSQIPTERPGEALSHYPTPILNGLLGNDAWDSPLAHPVHATDTPPPKDTTLEEIDRILRTIDVTLPWTQA